jgi:hypothetical protein
VLVTYLHFPNISGRSIDPASGMIGFLQTVIGFSGIGQSLPAEASLVGLKSGAWDILVSKEP